MDTPSPRPEPGTHGYVADLVLWDRLAVDASILMTGDLDGDGDAELIAQRYPGVGSPGVTLAVGNDLRTLWTHVDSRSGACTVGDTDGDGRADVVSGHSSERDSRDGRLQDPLLRVLNGRGKLQWEWRLALSEAESTRAKEFQFAPILVDDLDADGRPELLVWCETVRPPGTQIGRRQLMLIREGEPHPHAVADTAVYPESVAVGDVTGDGRHEIVVGGYAQNNGYEAYGIRDDECYVLVFDSNLQLVARSESLGDYYTGARVALFPRHGQPPAPIAAFMWVPDSHRVEYGGLHVLGFGESARLQPIASHRLPNQVAGHLVGDMVGDAAPELLLLTNAGQATLFDADGHGLSTGSHFLQAGERIAFGADLDGDGKLEVVSHPDNQSLRVSDLDEVQSTRVLHPAGPSGVGPERMAGATPWDVDNDGRAEVVVPLREADGHGSLAICRAVSAGPLVMGPVHAFEDAPDGLQAFEWSPNGTYLATIDASGVASVCRWRGRPGTRVCAVPEVRGLAFNPDGTSLAAIAGGQLSPGPVSGTEVCGGAALLTVDLTSGQQRTLLKGALQTQLGWTEQGRVLASCRRQRSFDIIAVDPGDGKAQPIPGVDDSSLDELSPVGGPSDALLFVRKELVPPPAPDGSWSANLYRLPRAGDKPRRFEPGPALVQGLRERRGRVGDRLMDRVEKHAWFYEAVIRPTSAVPGGSPFLPVVTRLREHDSPDWKPPLSPPYWDLPESVWLANLRTNELQMVSCEGDRIARAPRLSPDGEWIAYEAHKQYGEPETEIVVANLTGSYSVLVGRGRCPRWAPTRRMALWFIRDGQLRSTTVRFWQPPARPSAVARLVGAGVLGVVLTAGLVLLGVPARLRRMWATAMLAVRLARQAGHSRLFAELVQRLEAMHATMHSLKNSIAIMPAFEPETQGAREALEFIFSADNIAVAQALSEDLQQQVRVLAEHGWEYEAVTRGLPDEAHTTMREGLKVIAASQSLLASYDDKLRASAEALVDENGEVRTLPDAEYERALADVSAYYALLADEHEHSGLMYRLRECLGTLQVKEVLAGAARACAMRAASMGTSVEVDSGVSAVLHVPGNPGPVSRVVIEMITNALDSIGERVQDAPPDYAGHVLLHARDEEGRVAITITDNGAGLSPELAADLNAGVSRSTKAASRGAGFLDAHHILSAYPGGSIRIAPRGAEQGAQVTITFDSA